MWKKYFKNLEFPESYISITLGFLVVIVAGLMIYNYFTRSRQSTEGKAGEGQSIKYEEKKAENDTSLPTTHTVSSNENLWNIAEKYYGSGYNWVSIANENKLADADYVEAGQKLVIPKAEVIKPAGQISGTAASVEKPAKYTVEKGDSLWKIAVKFYGNGYKWTEISRANSLNNPGIIHAGNVLILP